MPEYRARFDAEISFTDGGGLSAQGFLLDVPAPTIEPTELARLFVASLGLLMTGPISLSNVAILEQPHKGSRGGPSDESTTYVELSHVIHAGMVTYPGLPAPTITPFLTREQSRARYAPGTEFAMDCINLIGNTGTYLDSPYHRYEGDIDLAGLSLERLVNLPALVLRVADSVQRGIDATTLAAIETSTLEGAALLLHTGGDARFGTPEYAINAGYLSRDGAQWLIDHRVALVGIDSVNIDDVDDTSRPAHSLLLEAGIPVVEHLTGLDRVPPSGARFTAVPPRIAEFGTFPVRAFASIHALPASRPESDRQDV